MSGMVPKVGAGRWPTRRMDAALMDGSGPIIGEEDNPGSIIKINEWLEWSSDNIPCVDICLWTS